jgi:hypothetical protein
MSKKSTAVVAAAGLSLGLLVGPVQGALAGHANEVLQADLDGRQEVAASAASGRIVGDPDGLGEVYVFGVDDLRETDGSGAVVTETNQDTLCYVLEVAKVSGTENNPGAPYAAHIHRGEPGSNGPVVVNLAFPTGGDAADCVTETRVGAAPANSPVFVRDAQGVPLATAQEILANPDAFYVNVHNADYPSGAIRGQIESHSHQAGQR